MLHDAHLYRFALPVSVLSKLKDAFLEIVDRTLVDRNLLIADIGNSIWFDFERAPADLVEQCITFLYPLAVPDAGCAGAEWWIRITRGDEPKCWHFDRDERLAELTGIVHHPKVASILYISAEGGPTLVTDQVLIPTQVSTDNSDHLSGVITTATRGALIIPSPNQLLTFPGQLRHCVLPRRTEPQGTRLTLLINWWLAQPHGLAEVRAGRVAELLSRYKCRQSAGWFTTPEEVPITFLDGQEIELVERGANA
jgi:hypothetical protein